MPAKHRYPVLDVARAGALAVVVLWHWSMSTVRLADDGPHVGNLVGAVGGLWIVTWVLQVMPLFFLVGGAVHARALAERGSDGFVGRRLRRLVLPAVPLLLPATAVFAFGGEAVRRTVVLVVSPLWFAAVYCVLVSLAPAMWRAQRRHPVGTPLALGAAVATVDALRFLRGWDHPLFVLLSFVVVWAAVHQLGFAWSALRSASTATKAAVAVAGYAGLAGCVAVLRYPAAMVGVQGAEVSNLGPPDAAVVFLGVAHLGLLALAADRLTRFADRRRALVDAASTWAMPVFVWHLLGWMVAYGAVRAVGVGVPSEVGAAWWVQRPLWIVLPALVTIPIVRRAQPQKVRATSYSSSSTSLSSPVASSSGTRTTCPQRSATMVP